MRRAGLVAGLVCLAAMPVAWPRDAAAQDAACAMLDAALQAGAYPAELDPGGGALAAVAAGSARDCTFFVGKATVAGVDLLQAAALRDPAVCDHLVEIALSGVMPADWQLRYGAILDRVAGGDLAACGSFFRDYGLAVLDGRGPVCTRTVLAAEAGMLGAIGPALEAAEGGDETICAAVMETQLAAPEDLAEPPESEDAVETGMCEAIRAAADADAFRPGWGPGRQALLALAEAADEAACRDLLADYGRAAPGRRLGPHCARAELALGTGEAARPDLLAAAVEVGAEVGCREVVRMHAAAR